MGQVDPWNALAWLEMDTPGTPSMVGNCQVPPNVQPGHGDFDARLQRLTPDDQTTTSMRPEPSAHLSYALRQAATARQRPNVPAEEVTMLATTTKLAGLLLFAAHGICLAQGGVRWQQATPSLSPTPRSGHAMTYDPDRRVVVLFGGNERYAAGARDDTWEWDGVNWTERTPTARPPARSGHALAFDCARRVAVLFGGRDAAGDEFADTWTWDGTTWTQATPAHNPPARADHAIADHAARQRVLLFGGADALGELQDTWVWDGTDWSLEPANPSPPARSLHAMAYDEIRHSVVLFAGSAYSDTWTWDGTWHFASPPNPPPDRRGHALAYDTVRQRVILFGGSHGGLFAFEDTWEWDGSVWTDLTTAGGPPARHGHATTYDAARQRVVVFSGQSSGTPLVDTWECGSLSPPRFTTFGNGCPGSLGTPSLHAMPNSAAWVGDTLSLALDYLPATSVPALLLGRSTGAAPLPFPGCTLWTSADVLLGLSLSGNRAVWTQPLPHDPGLVGLPLYVQGLAVNAGGTNPLGAALSNGAALALGVR
ncbi:MAG: hypothetical protein R3F56_19745 [Planctomycetota bacterium]